MRLCESPVIAQIAVSGAGADLVEITIGIQERTAFSDIAVSRSILR